jgi:hypothetical protein
VHLGIEHTLDIEQHCYVSVRKQPGTTTTTTTLQFQGLYKEKSATTVSLSAHSFNPATGLHNGECNSDSVFMVVIKDRTM